MRQLDSIVGIQPVLRISLASLAVGALLAVGLKIAIPQVILPAIWKMLLIVPGAVLYVLLIFAILSVVPRRIVICRERIVVEHSKKQLIECSSVETAWLVIHRCHRVRLKLRYRDADGHYRTCKIGIAESIDLQTLRDLLPVATIVRYVVQNPDQRN